MSEGAPRQDPVGQSNGTSSLHSGPTPLPERGLGAVLSSAANEAKTLGKDVAALGQIEFKEIAKHGGIGVGLFAGAAFTAICMLAMIFTGGAYGIARLLGAGVGKVSAGFFIIAGVLLIITVILALIGLSAVKKVKAPERTISAAKQASTSVQHAISRGVADAKTHELSTQHFYDDLHR